MFVYSLFTPCNEKIQLNLYNQRIIISEFVYMYECNGKVILTNLTHTHTSEKEEKIKYSGNINKRGT